MNKRYLLLFPILFGFFSCAGYDREVVINPVSEELPVSSSSGLWINSEVYDSSRYEIVHTFSTVLSSKQPLRGDTIPIELDGPLEELRAEYQGDAVVDLRIELLDVRSLDNTLITMERYVGAIGVLGAAGYLYMLNSWDVGNKEDLPIAETAIFGGASAALFGGSYLHQQFGSMKYSYKLDGKIVRLKN